MNKYTDHFFSPFTNPLSSVSRDKVSESPIMTSCFLALVIATLILRISPKNPTSPSGFDLTSDKITTSFSRPWKASIELISGWSRVSRRRLTWAE